MQNLSKRALALLGAAAMSASLAACGSTASTSTASESTAATPAAETAAATAETSVKTPKYIFLFIGDGMSYPQFQAASDYLGAVADPDYMKAEPSVKDRQGAKLDGPKEQIGRAHV